MRVGSAAHVHVEGFTCVLCGLRAYSRVNVRVTARVGLSEPRTGARLRVREQPMRPGLLADACVSNPCRRSPGTLTTSPQTALFHRYLARWSALWAPRSSGRSLDGGITPSKAPTRRRHADAALRMAQTPTGHRSGGRRREWRPGGPGRGAAVQRPGEYQRTATGPTTAAGNATGSAAGTARTRSGLTGHAAI